MDACIQAFEKEQMKEKIAVVTGANRGIGLEIVRQLAEKGATVVLTARDAGNGKTAGEQFQHKGFPVRFHQLDVTDIESIGRLTRYLQDEFGRADILVNNAGIAIDDNKSSLDVDIATVRKTMETNFFGPIQVSQAFASSMVKLIFEVVPAGFCKSEWGVLIT
jgi:NAD(P)-dependent dehydrogenase (short-subunit alcohol dehydrogenase family)